ncbi:hypothetical protein RchiOBHm_Chr6g0258361 [Rosa chinensis]|uniref:Uncharacterized protein n=1 Tax=Rosa chinensis TaxID=74649 RepID=A0A2P6PMK9_ROSCH|nr:hypothetical protein RchiOBHm_Chr6g0258361 [Rosa chinensis]
MCHHLAIRIRSNELLEVKVVGIVRTGAPFGGLEEDDEMWLYMYPENGGVQDRRLRLKLPAEDFARIGYGVHPPRMAARALANALGCRENAQLPELWEDAGRSKSYVSEGCVASGVDVVDISLSGSSIGKGVRVPCSISLDPRCRTAGGMVAGRCGCDKITSFVELTARANPNWIWALLCLPELGPSPSELTRTATCGLFRFWIQIWDPRGFIIKTWDPRLFCSRYLIFYWNQCLRGIAGIIDLRLSASLLMIL